ncbi:glycosyltransferase [Methylobacterium goesingense]|uniref:Glycosyltransferase involved in cell wall biosynthesis n=3 Tax=Methylobacterium goesingense TaxID=243690 RepID=A0ABV2L6T5_9HYPH|nr:glycosyltransferase [Methylobacterium goesingense]GJD75695.1 D-inositol-3-phosphate glycosyltransferase [Methylobacterium goesingense]
MLNDPDTTLAPWPGAVALSVQLDPITRILIRAPARPGPADGAVLQRAAAIVAGAGRGPEVRGALQVLLGLVHAHPACERLQILAARLVEVAELVEPGTQDREAVPARAWAGVHARFPEAVEPFRLVLRWTLRRQGREAAARLVRDRFPKAPATCPAMLLQAWGLEEIRAHAEADAAFERLIATHPRESTYVAFARALSKRGEIGRALRLLEDGIARFGSGGKLAAPHAAAAADCARLTAFCGHGAMPPPGRAADAVLAEIFARLAPTRRVPRRRRRVGRVMMITGSLGAGGAERQFALTARGLHAARVRAAPIAGSTIAGPIEVVVRSTGARIGGDFFAPGLRADGLAVEEYADFPVQDGDPARSVLVPFASMLDLLPVPMQEGTLRLADAIRRRRPHVVHLWQDGSILACGLAALAAGVPRIVLAVRSLPPVDRPERDRPEYAGLYRALLAAPGVRLTANSHAAARRYAAWLDLDPARVDVIYNGVDALPSEALPSEALPSDDVPAEAARAAAFFARTPHAGFTLGTVMRLDENKRPFLWLEAAARIRATAPDTRFIMVGDGPLREACEARAARLGLAGHVLFVGRSAHVGAWLARMDAFLLLSLVEGLPNVLVEAQHAGLPVVTTDAGGAAETIVPGRTGLLLPAGPDLTPEAVAETVLALRADAPRRAAMGGAARAWARETFSVAAMMERTVRSFLT